MDISYTTEEIPNTIDDKEIEVLIIALIKTLKHQKSKCGKDEVFILVKYTTEENITRDIFDKALESLIESGSVKCSFTSNRTCHSLRKHNAIFKIQICKEISTILKKVWLKILINWKTHFLQRLNHLKIKY